MNKKIVLSSCGIINENLKGEFYKLLNKEIEKTKVLYITTAIDGEDDSDTSWIAEEFKTILDLGIKKENIKEYKMDYEIDLSLYDMIYMMGGNTFYLLKKIRDTKFDIKLKEAINNSIVYVGSSAGSIILGNTIELALAYDKNHVNLVNFTGLKLIDGIIVPHANRKQEFIAEKLNIPVSKVYGVVTFYSFFTMEKKGKYVINVCLGTACFVRGADKILSEFERLLGIKNGETTPDGKFTLSSLRCVGACGLAPVVQVNGKTYGNATTETVKQILEEYRALEEK